MNPIEIADNFITQFHHLEGATVAQQKRHFFHLLNIQRELLQPPNVLNSITESLQPQNHLERLFIIDFWIYFRRDQELYNEFLKGNTIVIKKISNHRWFVEKISQNSVLEILPNLNYWSKLRILQKISLVITEAQADDLFDSIETQYGFFIASQMVLVCSARKLQEIMSKNPVRFTAKQLIKLYHKEPSLILLYLEERKKFEENCNFADYKKFFAFLARNDPNMYFTLQEKYDIEIKLGKRTSKKLIDEKLEEIIREPEKYVGNLHPACVVRKLGLNFKIIFLKLFPKRAQDSPKAQSSRLLKYYSKRQQYQLLRDTFNQVFHKKIEETPQLIDACILKLVSDAQERETLAKIKRKSIEKTSVDQEDYMKYFRPSECLKEIKEKINFARDSYYRRLYAMTLTSCCIINDDYEALLDIIKFIIGRFKNDSMQIYTGFLDALCWEKCDYSKFTEEHWELINKIWTRPDFYSHSNYNAFYNYLDFLCKNGRSLNEQIMGFYKHRAFSLYELDIPSKETNRQFLMTFIDLVPEIIASGDGSNTQKDCDCKLLAACRTFNSKNSFKIDVFQNPRLVETVIKLLSENETVEDNVLPLALEALLCSTYTSPDLKHLQKLFWSKPLEHGSPFLIKWHLKHNPEILLENIENLLIYITSNKKLNNATFWRQLQCIMGEKAAKIALEKVKNPETENPECWVLCLSHMMPSEDYLNLVNSYAPLIHTVDLQNDEIRRKFQIQKYLLKELANINQPLLAIPLILKYCKNDYVASCMSPLYCAFYKAPSNEILAYIDHLSTHEATPVKKLYHHLIITIFDKQTISNVLSRNIQNNVTNVAFKYFQKNPSQDTWVTFINALKYYKKDDKKTGKLLARGMVPSNYKRDYFIEIVNVLPEQYVKILLKEPQTTTISSISLPDLAKIINKFSHLEEINTMLSHAIICGCSNKEKIDLVLDLLKTFPYKQVSRFISTLSEIYWLTEVEPNPLLVQSFSQKFRMEENFLIEIMGLKNCDIQTITSSIIHLHNIAIEKYGQIITIKFVEIIQKVLPYFCKEDCQKYYFYYLLLQQKQSVNDIHLLVYLLPKDAEPEDVESFKYYDEVVSQLEALSTTSVQILLNLHFKLHKIPSDVGYYETIGSGNIHAINTSSWIVWGAKRRVGYEYY